MREAGVYIQRVKAVDTVHRYKCGRMPSGSIRATHLFKHTPGKMSRTRTYKSLAYSVRYSISILKENISPGSGGTHL